MATLEERIAKAKAIAQAWNKGDIEAGETNKYKIGDESITIEAGTDGADKLRDRKADVKISGNNRGRRHDKMRGNRHSEIFIFGRGKQLAKGNGGDDMYFNPGEGDVIRPSAGDTIVIEGGRLDNRLDPIATLEDYGIKLEGVERKELTPTAVTTPKGDLVVTFER